MVVVIIVLLVVLMAGILIFNYQISARIRLQEALSGIDVQLKRRHELIPNLVEVVKGYGHYEKSLLEKVTQARTQPVAAGDLAESRKLEGDLSRGLRSLFAVVEAYPNLKADQQFLSLQSSLVKVEDELQMARRYYNGSVRDYNISVLSFPGNIIAGIAGFQAAVFFEVDYATERAVPDVTFSTVTKESRI